MKTIYLTGGDVHFIYDDLKSQGYFQWYIILKTIEEAHFDYTFLSKLTWADLIHNDKITDVSGLKEKEFVISNSLKDEIHDVITILDIDNLSEPIVGLSGILTAKDLYKQLCTYDSIKNYNKYSKFRIDYFGNHTTDSYGVKTYAMKTIDDDNVTSYIDKVSTYSIYIAEIGDKRDDERPKKYKLKFYDKKIGIAKNVGERMEDLSNDKRLGGTLSPLYVKALKAWHMPTKLCRDLETEMHRYFEDRGTGGEWFTDYNNDIIGIVESKIKELESEGKKIYEININKENEDISFLAKLTKDQWEEEPKEFIERVKYEI